MTAPPRFDRARTPGSGQWAAVEQDGVMIFRA